MGVECPYYAAGSPVVLIYLSMGGTHVFLLSSVVARCSLGILGLCSKSAWPGMADVFSLPLSLIGVACFSV